MHGTRLRLLVLITMSALGSFGSPVRALAQISPGPLAKAHAELEGAANCAKCHGLRREPMTQLCLGCHRDVQWMMDQNRGLHAREVRVGKKECAGCHPDHAGAGFALVAWTEGAAPRFDHRRAGWTLDGKHTSTKCESCHATEFRVSAAAALSKRRAGAGWLGLETTCASCHKADDVHQNALGAKCESCHDAREWKTAGGFDHERSNYPLTGKHTDVVCNKCHLAARLGVRANAKGERVPLFKPVPFRECSSCHDDPHKGRLSSKCGECHVTRGFDVIDKRGFSHALTRYPLEGKHRSVTCDACHGANLANPKPAFATCGSCHADAHRGEATLAGKPADCAACHRLAGFAPSTYTVAAHKGTSFVLGGLHQQVKCTACHTTFAAAPKAVRLHPAAGHCGDCHVDAHGGQLAARATRGTCEGCHTDAGWKPSTFAIAAHASLKLALEGRHAAITCAACHGLTRPGLPALTATTVLGRAKVLLAVPETDCASCHADPHAGRYARGGARSLANGCRSCHGLESWRPAAVTVATHAQFAYPLDGAHRAVPCVSCHVELKGVAATATLVRAARGITALPFMAQRSTACQTCHTTPHGTQFATRKDAGSCEACHGVDAFAPAALFDHERDAAFSLKGAHAKVTCGACHRPQKVVVYRGLSAKCESCHTGRVPRGNV